MKVSIGVTIKLQNEFHFLFGCKDLRHVTDKCDVCESPSADSGNLIQTHKTDDETTTIRQITENLKQRILLKRAIDEGKRK